MQIPRVIFEQLTGLVGVQFECSPRDKRKVPRIDFSRCIEVIPVKDHRPTPPIQARTRDISATGIGILCSRPMPAGDAFLICLPQKRGGQTWIVCNVTRCKPAAENLYIIGAVFAAFQHREAPPAPAEVSASTR
ncbi:MAG: PilZ domain-containing protein [Bacillota bacterium]